MRAEGLGEVADPQLLEQPRHLAELAGDGRRAAVPRSTWRYWRLELVQRRASGRGRRRRCRAGAPAARRRRAGSARRPAAGARRSRVMKPGKTSRADLLRDVAAHVGSAPAPRSSSSARADLARGLRGSARRRRRSAPSRSTACPATWSRSRVERRLVPHRPAAVDHQRVEIAAVAASSSTARTDACGASISASDAALPSLPWYWRSGRRDRQHQQPPRARAHVQRLRLRALERAHADRRRPRRRAPGTRAPPGRCPAARRPCGIVPNVQVVRPVRSSLRVAAASVARSVGRTRSRSASRSCPAASTSPRSSSTLNVIRRCAGSRARSQASRATRTPRCALDLAPPAPPAAARCAAAAARARCAATSGTGTSGRRSSFGSERISAIDELGAQRRHEPVEARRRAAAAAPSAARARSRRRARCRARSGRSAAARARPAASRPAGPATSSAAAGLTSSSRVNVSRSGPLAALVAPPAVEVRAGDDVVRDPRVVEVEEHLVVDEDVAPARAVLERLDLLDQRRVVGDEAVARVPVALDQRAADEQLARQRPGRSRP